MTGLNYQSVEVVMRIHQVDDPTDTFERVRVLECAALSTLNECRQHG